MTPRISVYAAISSERDYQESKWKGHLHEAESWLLFIEHYVHEARVQASKTDFTEVPNLIAYLDSIRKITALGVACMEQHGAPKRPVS